MKKPEENVFAARLRHARETLKGWTQGQLAEETKLPPTSISHFENPEGTRKPSFENLRRLAKALGVTTDYLIGRTSEPYQHSEAVDELYRDMQRLSESDRQIAKELIERLAQCKQQNK